MPDSEDGVTGTAENPFVHRGPDDMAGDLRILETEVDDVSPEVLGGLQDRLAAVGAHQVSVMALTSSDSRPGHLVRVIVNPGAADAVARELAKETGTLGVRELRAAHRFVAETELVSVEIEIENDLYEVQVKLAVMDGTVYDVSAEYVDAESVAESTELSTAAVMHRAERAVDATDYSPE